MRLLFITLTCILSACGSGTDPQPKPAAVLYFPSVGDALWETVQPDELGWNVSVIPTLDDYVVSSNTRALLILKDGKIAYEKYNGNALVGTAPFTQNSYWYWASAGKTLTSFLVGHLEGQGMLDLDDPSNQYLGEGWSHLTTQQEQAITVRHHLTMTTGLDYTVPDADCTDPECLTYLNAPGTAWYYHNAPYTRLDGVIEGASGQDFDTYFEENLQDKIGMDGFWTYNDFNHVYYSTPRSMARFGLLIMAEGKWEGKEILDNRTYFNDMINTSQTLNQSYGYLWWLNGKGSFISPGFSSNIPSDITPNAPDDMFAAMGKNGQVINIVPSYGLVVVRMGNDPDTGLVPFTFQDDMWEIIMDLVE
jgi:CubicO group peptidase (beta-lactamase class C family)